VALVLAVWVVSAYHGREYLSASLDAANLERKIGWPIALSIFGVSTTFIWLGLVVGTLVIAWRRWSVLQPQRAERAGSTSSDR
jgi:hypothetical protein